MAISTDITFVIDAGYTACVEFLSSTIDPSETRSIYPYPLSITSGDISVTGFNGSGVTSCAGATSSEFSPVSDDCESLTIDIDSLAGLSEFRVVILTARAAIAATSAMHTTTNTISVLLRRVFFLFLFFTFYNPPSAYSGCFHVTQRRLYQKPLMLSTYGRLLALKYSMVYNVGLVVGRILSSFFLIYIRKNFRSQRS